MSKPSGNPYIGPRTFQKNEGHLFFGREREARDLIALVTSERLVVFYAQSGAGKSSIVNTRLIPNLEAKEYEVLPVGRVGGDAPEGVDVANIYIYNLLRSLEQHESDPVVFSKLSLARFLARLNSDTKGFFYDASMVEVVTEEEDGVEIVKRALVIDQFEELFSTHPEAWEKRDDFFLQLAQAMEKDPYLWVVLVMREDFIASLDPYAHYLENGLRVRYYMQRLEREAALKAVKNPVAGIRPYAEGVAEKLIDDLCSITVQRPDGELDVQPGQYVEPVQMQVVCYGLWDNLPPDGTQITGKDLEDVGDVNQSLGKYYDKRVGEVAKARNVKERLIREWIEKKLITAGGIRNMVLQERETKPGELHDDVIQALQSDLVRAEKRGGATWYELTHDRLVEPILERNKVWFEEHLSPLQRQAALWNDQNRQESWLLSDHALVEMEVWAGTHKDELTEVEKEFLTACQKLQIQINERQAAERERLKMAQRIADEQAHSARRARQGNVIAGILLIAAVIAMLVAFWSSKKAATSAEIATTKEAIANAASTEAVQARSTAIAAKEDAQASELSAIALERYTSDPELAILLGLQADKIKSNNRTQIALLSLQQKTARLNGILKGDAQQFLYSPDGNTIATLDENGITFWDTTDIQKPLNSTPLNGHVSLISAIVSYTDEENNKILVSGADDGTIAFWNASTHQIIVQPLAGHIDRVSSLVYSLDGKTLASGSYGDNKIILWDVEKQEQTNQLPVDRTISSLALSKDGKFLASASYDDNTITLWDVMAKPPTSRTLNAETYGISSLAFSSDGKTLASANYYDNTITLWDMAKTPPTPETLRSDTYGVSSLAFSPDGKTLASTSDSNTIILWDIEKAKPIGQPIQTQGRIFQGITFLDSNTIISGDGKSISFWDISKPENPQKEGDPLEGHLFGSPTGMRFSPDGSILASQGDDGTILWDVKNLENPKLLESGGIEHFSPNGQFLAYEIYDIKAETYLIHIRKTSTGGLIDTINGRDPHFSPNGRLLEYQTLDTETGSSYLHIWDIQVNKEIEPPNSISGKYLAFSPDSKTLAYKTTDTTNDTNIFINLWDIPSRNIIDKPIPGDFVAISQNGKIMAFQKSENNVSSINLMDISTGKSLGDPKEGEFVAISSDGSILIYTTTETNNKVTLQVITTLSGKEIYRDNNYSNSSFQILGEAGDILVYEIINNNNGETSIYLINKADNSLISEGTITGTFLSLTADGKILVYQTNENNSNTIYFWDTENNQALGDSIKGKFLALSPDSETALIRSENQIVTLWNINKTWPIGEPIGKETEPVSNAVLSADGNRLVQIDDKGLVLQNAENGEIIGGPFLDHFSDFPGAFPAFSPDGNMLAIGSWVDNTTTLWSLNTQEQIGKFDGFFPTFSPDGMWLAIGHNTNYTFIWDVSTQKQTNIEKFSGYFPSFSPNGSLAIGNIETWTTSIWDMNNFEQIDEFSGIIPAFNFDGGWLAIGGGNSTVIWDVKTHEQIGSEINGGIFPAFSRDGNLLALGGFDSNYETATTTLWNLKTHERIDKDEFPGNGTAFSPDGMILASGSEITNITTLWEIDSKGKKVKPIQRLASGTDAVFSQDGRFLASYNQSDSIVIRDLKANKVIARLRTDDLKTINYDHKITSTMGFIANNGLFAALDEDDSLITWDIASGIPNIPNISDQKFPYNSISPFFSPDQKYLIYGTGKSLGIWDIVKNESFSGAVTSLDFLSDHTYLVVFSSNGKIMAVSDNNKIQIYTFPELRKLDSEFIVENSLNNFFLIMDQSDVKYLITYDQFGITQIRDWSTGAKVGESMSNINFIGSSTMDKPAVYLDPLNRLIHFEWNPSTETWKNILCPKANRNFTLNEWTQYLGGQETYPYSTQVATCPDYPIEDIYRGQ